MNKYTESDNWQTRGNPKKVLLSVVGACLSVTLLSASKAKAETCTASPDCKSLGYTESSCPDGGVKCPWGNYWFCGGGKSCKLKNCEIGDVLYGDKKCYTCPNAYTLPGQAPIGVVFTPGKAVGLTDLGCMTWSDAKSTCSSYSVGGVSGWYLPNKAELVAMHTNRSKVVQGFSNALGGNDFQAASYYWSSVSYDGDHSCVVNLVNGMTSNLGYIYSTNTIYVRPVLAF